jgi:hypothetical protein
MTRTLSCLAASLAMMVAGGAAFAQQPARPAQPAPAQPAPAQPQAPPSSPSHLAVARDVVVLSGMTRTFDVIPPEMGEQIKKNAVTRPDLAKDLDQVIESLKPEMELQKQQMVNAAARVYASRISEAELKEIAAFFKSPVGKKYVETQPQILDSMVVEIQNWTKQLAEYVMVRVRAEMGKRGHQM